MRRAGNGEWLLLPPRRSTPKNGRRRVRLKPLNPAAADYLFDKIESERVACLDKGDALAAVGQTMAKLAVLERLSRK
jgi:hypothetical protein